jgi:hypothetical protein
MLLKVFMRKHLGSLSQIETALAKDGITEGVITVTPSLEVRQRSSGISECRVAPIPGGVRSNGGKNLF